MSDIVAGDTAFDRVLGFAPGATKLSVKLPFNRGAHLCRLKRLARASRRFTEALSAGCRGQPESLSPDPDTAGYPEFGIRASGEFRYARPVPPDDRPLHGQQCRLVLVLAPSMVTEKAARCGWPKSP